MVQLSLVTNAMRIPAFGGGGGWGGWFNQPSNRGMTWVQQGQPLHQPWAVVVWEWLVGWLVGWSSQNLPTFCFCETTSVVIFVFHS